MGEARVSAAQRKTKRGIGRKSERRKPNVPTKSKQKKKKTKTKTK